MPGVSAAASQSQSMPVSESFWGPQESEVMEDGWYLKDAPENCLPKLLLWESGYFL